MSTPYDRSYSPPVPVLRVSLSAPAETPHIGPLTAIIDTGADGTLIPSGYLEAVEAVGDGEAILHGALGEAREVHLFEVDLHLDSRVLPGVIAVADDYGHDIVLGRNVLNKLVLLLDGPGRQTDWFEQRPR
jgi:hypothetical protein